MTGQATSSGLPAWTASAECKTAALGSTRDCMKAIGVICGEKIMFCLDMIFRKNDYYNKELYFMVSSIHPLFSEESKKDVEFNMMFDNVSPFLISLSVLLNVDWCTLLYTFTHYTCTI